MFRAATVTFMATGSEILQFIRENRAWHFDSTRDKTRRACIELLSRLPFSVSDFIVGRKRLLLTAPGFGLAGTVNPYVVELSPDEKELRVQIISLAPILEHSSARMIVGFTAKCVAVALRPILSPTTPAEEIADAWGFGRDIKKASEYSKRMLRP